MLYVASVVSNSLQPYGLQPARLLCPRNFPGKNSGVGCHFLLQGLFRTQGSNPHLLLWQPDSLALSHQGKPNYHYNIIQNTLSALNILSALPCNPWQPTFTASMVLLFPKCQYGCYNIVHSLFRYSCFHLVICT